MNFVLFVPTVPPYSKQDIDQGETPLFVYQIIEAIRGAFFLSHALRKEVTFAIAALDEDLLITYFGEYLRYLGPDERGQALLLERVLTAGRSLADGEQKETTPGLIAFKGQWTPIFQSICRGGVLDFEEKAPVAISEEILQAGTSILHAGADLTDELQSLIPTDFHWKRAFPPPYDVAGFGAKISYLQYVRDCV